MESLGRDLDNPELNALLTNNAFVSISQEIL
jgi:hypothetical protein